MKIPSQRVPTSPGEILKDMFLDPTGISQAQLARHLGWTQAKVSNIITGRLGVTAETALSLADAFGTSAEVWINAQTAIDLWRARQKHDVRRPLLRKSAA